MVIEISHKELSELIKINYETKIPLIIYGSFGLGKSRIVLDTSKEIAIKEKREFIEWDKTDDKKKEELFKNPEKYFVVMDFRSSSLDPTDLRGLPNFRPDKKTIEWKIPYFMDFMTIKGSLGVAFWDEISLGTPLVLSSLYKIIYDRAIDGCKINDGWFMIMAGNLESDHSNAIEIPAPLKDRSSEVILRVSDISTFTDFCIKNKIDSRIIGFLNFKSSNIHKINFDDAQKQTSPRGWCERVDKLIKKLENNDYEKLRLVTSSAIGEGVACEFVAFCKLQDKVKIQEIIKNPNKLKDLDKEKDLGIKYFIVTALADCYRDKRAKFEDIMKITEVLDELNNAEFVSLLWRLCLMYNKDFEKEFLKSNTTKFANKYIKYLYAGAK